MKPILWEMNEITDSTEVYESRPNPFLAGTIYLIFGIVIISIIWMYVAKMDIVVKGNGMFKGEEKSVSISSGVSGKIKTCDVEDGQYVEEGQTLFTLEVDSLDSSIASCKKELKEIKQRITILKAYQKALDGESSALDGLKENPYYTEFLNRKQLLDANIAVTDENVQGQKSQYQKNVESIEESIKQYEEKIDKLSQAMTGVKQKTNPFGVGDNYYHSLVSSYLSNYDSVSLSYDNQIATYQNNMETLKQQKKQVKKQEQVETEEGMEDSVQTTISQIEQQIAECEQNIATIKAEKEKTLQSLELEQTAALEQEITSAQSAIQSLESNLTSAKVQLEALESAKTERSDEVTVLSEKNSVATELLTYENKQKECENNLESLNIQNGNCQIKATSSGYITMQAETEEGTYVQQGTEICQILPEEYGEYYAEVYVENQDIGKLEEGQEVKFEIAAYPSSEYGYFTGTIDSISKDIKVDQTTGNSYYVAKVLCNKTTVTNKKGETGTIKNGMACQAKIVVDAQRVLGYVLEKIDLLD